MTRKLLLTTAIVALVLGPSLGTRTAHAHGFYGGYGRGFYGGYGRGFYGGFGHGFYGGYGRRFYGGYGGFYPGFYGYGRFPYCYYCY